jgi:hypothetical protein
MRAYHGLGPDDRDGLEDRRKLATQLDEEQSIAVRQLDPRNHRLARRPCAAAEQQVSSRVTEQVEDRRPMDGGFHLGGETLGNIDLVVLRPEDFLVHPHVPIRTAGGLFKNRRRFLHALSFGTRYRGREAT